MHFLQSTDSCIVPKDTACGINAWGGGRSRRCWGPDVLQYRPERWLDSDLNHTHATYLLAFSYGRRSCIGEYHWKAMKKEARVLQYRPERWLESDLDHTQVHTKSSGHVGEKNAQIFSSTKNGRSSCSKVLIYLLTT